MDKIKRGDRIFAYLSGRGYVGVGVALADAAPINRVETSDTSGHVRPVIEMPFAIGRASEMHLGDPIRAERAARVDWLKAASRDGGFYERDIFHSPMTTRTLHDKRTAERVLSHFGLSESIGETPG